MLEARYHPLLNTLIYHALVRPALRGGFFRVNARLSALPPSPEIPVIWYGNHSSWWDGYLPFVLNRLIWKRQGYVMVEDTQLSRYQFFRWAGGFSINRGDARSALASLNYSARLLSAASNRLLLMYPQGAIAANDTRPLIFFNGIGHIVKAVLRERGAVALVPLAMRYEFIGEQKPEAFASFGAARVFDEAGFNPQSLTAMLEAELTGELDRLRADVTAYRLEGFQTLLSGGQSINRMFDRITRRKQIRDVGR